MGVMPNRIEIITGISGVDFTECYPRRRIDDLWGIDVPVIDLEDLKRNKRAAGRHKDLADVDELLRPTLAELIRRKRGKPRRST